MTNLGIMYSIGRGVPKDHKEAMKWLRKAEKLKERSAAAAITLLEGAIQEEAEAEKNGEEVLDYKEAQTKMMDDYYLETVKQSFDDCPRSYSNVGRHPFLRHGNKQKDEDKQKDKKGKDKKGKTSK